MSTREVIRLTTPLSAEAARSLRAGDKTLISGVIYTARDAAHKRLYELLKSGGAIPIDLRDQIIYYTGPTPAKPGQAIGSAGPTTSGRMDFYTPLLIKHGLRATIGKGERSPEVISSMREHSAVYLAATGGAAALLAKRITSCEIAAYEDLGTEAIRRLTVIDFPAIVINDALGGDVYRDVIPR